MATWQQLVDDAPDLAEAARGLWPEGSPLMYLATTRPDGSPRVHPVVPFVVDGQVVVAIPDRSPKWRDLRAEPRCVLHALPGERDDELVLRGRATERPDLLAAARQVAAHTLHDDDHLVVIDLDQVDLGWWVRIGQPDTDQARRRWRPHGGVRWVRHLPEAGRTDT